VNRESRGVILRNLKELPHIIVGTDMSEICRAFQRDGILARADVLVLNLIISSQKTSYFSP
jgi:uncharacterized radical SAM superfamily protein